MRFDSPIYMQKIIKGEYNIETGDYQESNVEETEVYADISNSGIETLKLYYGEIREGSLVIRLQRHYTETFNRIRIGEKQYRVDFERKLRIKHIFIVSEVQ